MRLAPAVLFLGLGGWLGGCGDSTSEPESARSFDRTVRVGETLREYRLYVPTAVDTAPDALPLVIVFHGGNGSAARVEELSGLNTFAEPLGFLAAYPESVTGDWAEGCDCSKADLQGVNDIGLARTLIATLSAEYRIDPRRVYAVGYSAGGLFVYRLACELSDLIAGVASVAGPMSEPLAVKCQPDHPVSVLLIHGTEDGVLSYYGSGQGRYAVLGAEPTVAKWAEWNGCPDTPTIRRPPDLFNDRTMVAIHDYAPCEDGAEVRLLSVEGGIHYWWLSQEFNTSEQVISFLLAHERNLH
jgi:polyhydroxybutyrate depolymerase